MVGYRALARVRASRGAAVAGRPSVVDTFTRADNASSMGSTETGQVWTALSNTWGITSNRGYAAVTGAGMAITDGGSKDAVLTCTNNRPASNTGLMIRTNAAGSGGYLIRSDGSNVAIDQNFGGNPNVASAAFAWGSGAHTWRVVCIGSTLAVYVDGVLKLSYTEVTPQTGTYYGLWKNSAQTTGQWFDDFSITSP